MTRSGRVVLVLGGARSGKSSFAEKFAGETGLTRHYIATGRAYDAEMEDRIQRHRDDRGPGWITHETPLNLASNLRSIDSSDVVILVDCLTLWVTNLMMAEADIASAGEGLLADLRNCSATVILVSNEVGLGIVPDNRMAREFRDHAGRLHQAIAAEADEVFFVAAGLPLKMKG